MRRPIAEYFELQFQLKVETFKSNLLNDKPNEKENVDMLIKQISEKLQTLEIELSNTEIPNNISNGFMHISKGINKTIKRILSRGYLPDLKQGMILPAYLFGKILDDYKYSLFSEGSYNPIPEIYMSHNVWDCDEFMDYLKYLEENLKNHEFNCKMEAIIYFNNIKTSLNLLVDKLRAKGQVSWHH